MPTNPRYLFIMTPEGYDAVREIAERDNRVFADVVRIALEEYTSRELKRKVSFRVKRGGNRREQNQ
jgi:hypothetical protein